MRRKLKSWVVIFFLIICFISLIYSAYKIFFWKVSLDKNEEIKEQVIEEAITINEETDNDEEKYLVNFARLKESNSDTVAYLTVNNTAINYVVVRGSDNSYYLKHNFNKEWNEAGWIFADYKNKFDGSDKNIVIYGHNMNDGSMFGSLRNILKDEWVNNNFNYNITLVMENVTYLYQVFSTYSIEPEDYYINTSFNSNEEYNLFLNTIKDRSFYNYNVDISDTSSILTLSTCSVDGNKRIVLHAKKIN